VTAKKCHLLPYKKTMSVSAKTILGPSTSNSSASHPTLGWKRSFYKNPRASERRDWAGTSVRLRIPPHRSALESSCTTAVAPQSGLISRVFDDHTEPNCSQRSTSNVSPSILSYTPPGTVQNGLTFRSGSISGSGSNLKSTLEKLAFLYISKIRTTSTNPGSQ